MPEERVFYCRFVQMTLFQQNWDKLGLQDDDLRKLEQDIMSSPNAPVIQGTGGLRKLRFSPPSWNKGKRSATRVAFVYLELHSIVLLMSVYSKGEKLNITPQERVVYKKTISQIRKNLRGDAT